MTDTMESCNPRNRGDEMTGPVEVLPVDHAAVRDYMTERARLAFNGTTGPHADLLLKSFARHRLAAALIETIQAATRITTLETALRQIADGADDWQIIALKALGDA